MHRRTYLTGLAAGVALTAGCGSSSDDEPSGSRGGEKAPSTELRVPEYDFEEGEGESTVVVLTVNNPGPEDREVTMVTTIFGEGEERVTAERVVTFESDSERTVRMEFDVPWSWFSENQNLRSVDFVDV